MFFGLMLCPVRPLESLRQKHCFTTGKSWIPTFLGWQFIIKEGLSALKGVSALVLYAEERKRFIWLIQADALWKGIDSFVEPPCSTRLSPQRNVRC